MAVCLSKKLIKIEIIRDGWLKAVAIHVEIVGCNMVILCYALCKHISVFVIIS